MIDEKIFYIQNVLETKKDTSFFSALHTFIIKYDLEHSTNSNGIFLNLSVINEEIIDEIYKYLSNMDISSTEYKEQNKKDYLSMGLKDKKQANISMNNKSVGTTPEKISLEKFDKHLIQLSKQHVSI